MKQPIHINCPLNFGNWCAILLIAMISPAVLAAESNARLSLEAVLAAIKSQESLNGLEKAASEWSDAAYRAADPSLGSWNFETDYSIGPRIEDEPQERKIGGFIEKTLRLGVNYDALKQQYDAESKRTSLDAKANSLSTQRAAAEQFVLLHHLSRMAHATQKILAAITPVLPNPDHVAAQGGTDGLSLLKWKILKEELTATRDDATANFESNAKELSRKTGLSISINPELAALDAPQADISRDTSIVTSYLTESIKAQADAASKKANVHETSFEFTAGIGAERELSKKSTSYVARLSVPLGQRNVAKSARKEALATSAVFEALAKSADQQLKQELSQLILTIKSSQRKISSLQARKAAVEGIFNTALHGISRGITDYAQVMEASEKLLELERECSEALQDYQSSIVQFNILTGGV